MDLRVLVAYATKYGATEIAEKVGQVLRQAGLPADVLPADRVGDLSPYKAVVLSSAVYMFQSGRLSGLGGHHRMGQCHLRRTAARNAVSLQFAWCSSAECAIKRTVESARRRAEKVDQVILARAFRGEL
jgi:hypothetical protein